MDRRTQADRDPGKGLPTGQTSRGYPASTAKNPKNNSSRRPDVSGNTGPGLVDVDAQTTREIDPTGYPSTIDMSAFGKGNPATIPGPENINRGYTQVTGANVPRVTKNTGANRQNYSIDPGTPPQPQGDNSEGPGVPHYGVGSTGD